MITLLLFLMLYYNPQNSFYQEELVLSQWPCINEQIKKQTAFFHNKIPYHQYTYFLSCKSFQRKPSLFHPKAKKEELTVFEVVDKTLLPQTLLSLYLKELRAANKGIYTVEVLKQGEGKVIWKVIGKSKGADEDFSSSFILGYIKGKKNTWLVRMDGDVRSQEWEDRCTEYFMHQVSVATNEIPVMNK